ncbi:MAG: hypothetical protein RLY47_359 [Candidatus Parcubacteria bacterium]|jgi:Tol biopolymer transport system component
MRRFLLASFLFLISACLPLFAQAAVVTNLSPEDDAVNTTIFNDQQAYYLIFDEAIVAGTGNITLYKASDDSVVETLDVTDPEEANFSGVVVYVLIDTDLATSTEYYFQIDAGAIVDFAGISDETTWSFTTDAYDTPRGIDSLSPGDDAIDASLNPEDPVSIYFDGLVYTDTGNITLYKASDDSIVETWDITNDEEVTVENQGVYFSRLDLFEPATEYYILIDVGAIVPFAGITDETTWNFTTEAAPAIVTLNPADGETGVSIVLDSYTIEFDKNIYGGTGNITLYKASDDSVVDTFDVSVEEEVTISNATLTLHPAVDLERSTDYYFTIDSTAIVGFTGIADETTWNFTTLPPPTFEFERVSVNDEGEEADGDSANLPPQLSEDGRYIVFESDATNLVLEDTNDSRDIFVYDRDTDTIELASANIAGEEGDGHSISPYISSDGRYVVFSSAAENLTDNISGSVDIFLYDRTLGSIEQVNTDGVSGDSFESPSISDDGRYVVYTQRLDSDGRYDIILHDRELDTETNITSGSDGQSRLGVISKDGTHVVLVSASTDLVVDDTNGRNDVFVYDRVGETIERVSVSDEGVEGNNDARQEIALSSDGRYIAFASDATNLVSGDTSTKWGVFVYDRDTDTIDRLIDDDEESTGKPSISSDGRYVVFTRSTDGGEGQTNNIFRYDRESDTLLHITENSLVGGNGGSVSGDGHVVAFASDATDLVESDTNDDRDVFVWDEGVEDEEEPDDDNSGGGGGGGSTHRKPISNPPSFREDTDLFETLRSLIVEFIAQGGTPSPAMLAFLGTPTTSNLYTRDLDIGSQGDDVLQLQLFLIAQNKGPAAQSLAANGATGFFGPLTQAALVEYQASVGITPAVGFFGPVTRAYVNGL